MNYQFLKIIFLIILSLANTLFSNTHFFRKQIWITISTNIMKRIIQHSTWQAIITITIIHAASLKSQFSISSHHRQIPEHNLNWTDNIKQPITVTFHRINTKIRISFALIQVFSTILILRLIVSYFLSIFSLFLFAWIALQFYFMLNKKKLFCCCCKIYAFL